MVLAAVQPIMEAKAPVPLAGLTGWVIVYSPTYHFQAGLVYKNGAVEPQQVSLKTVKVPKKTLDTKVDDTNTTNLTAQPTCISVTTCGYVGPYLSNCITDVYCVEGGGGDGGGGGGDGGGWGGGGGQSSIPNMPLTMPKQTGAGGCVPASLAQKKLALCSNGKNASQIEGDMFLYGVQ
ncbi:hypothetical protein GCM10027422_32680 [Hymenobacter arcticus]